MSLHQHSDGRWYVRYGETGKDIKKYFGRGDIARAQAAQFQEELDHKRGRGEDIPGITIATLLAHYHKNHLVEKSTADSDFYRIDRVLNPMLGNIYAERLGSQDLNGFVQERLKAGKALRTIDRELDILRSAYNWGQSQEPLIVLRNPMQKYRLKIPRQAGIVPVTEDEFERLMRHAPDHLIPGWHGQLVARAEGKRYPSRASHPGNKLPGPPVVPSNGWTVSYQLQESTSKSFIVATTFKPTRLQRIFTHAVGTPTTYFYRVRGVNAYGKGAWSQTVDMVVLP